MTVNCPCASDWNCATRFPFRSTENVALKGASHGTVGVHTGVDVFKLMDVAEDIVVPMMDQPIRVDRDSLILGFAGVYSSFLLHAKRAGAKYGVPSADILVELGRQKTVGGQEDMIEDVALNMARARSRERGAA